MNLLLISPPTHFAIEVKNRLAVYGIEALLFEPKPLVDLGQLIDSLALFPFIARLENDRISLTINNFAIQDGIRQAEALHWMAPDMWVQFGSNIALMRQSLLDPEWAATRIAEELLNDDRFISERKEDVVI